MKEVMEKTLKCDTFDILSSETINKQSLLIHNEIY